MDDQIDDGVDSGSATENLNFYLAVLREQRGNWAPSPSDADAKLEYHVFADAVFWSDEFPRPIPSELENAFRMVINHRTSLLLGDEGRFAEVWTVAKEYYPNWPGFLPERCQPSPAMGERIKRIRRISKRLIERSGISNPST